MVSVMGELDTMRKPMCFAADNTLHLRRSAPGSTCESIMNFDSTKFPATGSDLVEWTVDKDNPLFNRTCFVNQLWQEILGAVL